MKSPKEPSKSLQLLLEYESRSAILECRFARTKLYMWPYIRWRVARLLADRIYGTSYLNIPPVKPSWRYLPSYLYQLIAKAPLRSSYSDKDIVLICSGVGNFKREPGRFFNRLADYFAFEKEKTTVIIENSDCFRFKTPRTFPVLCYHDALKLEVRLKAPLLKISAEDERSIQRLISDLRGFFGKRLTDQEYLSIYRILKNTARKMPIWERQYRRLFEKLRPKLVILEDACYGTYGHITSAAKRSGAKVAEFQHGLVNRNHEAYYFSSELLDSPITNDFPDFFLGYGKYWMDQIRIPCRKLIIGNPHLSAMVRQSSPVSTANTETKTILFVSSALNPELYRRFISEMIDHMPDGYAVCFRPHPQESKQLSALYGDFFESFQVEIDSTDNIFDSISTAEALIVEISTAAYEALALNKRVFIIDTEESRKYMDPNLFEYFVTSGSELCTSLKKRQEAGVTGVDSDYVWASGWRDNYHQFLNDCIYN